MSTFPGTLEHPASLPVVLTPMLGRECETADLLALMRDPAERLVTIIGPGGVGKTRLAIGAVSAAAGFDVVFVPLAAIREPERIVPAIGQVIGLNLEAGDGDEGALFDALGEREAILLLDNLEQVPGAAPVLSRLLSHVPGLTILVTSQVAVEARGERIFPLAPLAVPDASGRDALASDAVVLFLDRARVVDPMLDTDAETLAAIADICRRLDGLPLAIELAAARVNLLSPRALLERLDDRFGMLSSGRGDVADRHRTLRAAIAWTYDLLDPVEQALFRRLSVFVDGVPLAGAEAVFAPADGRNVREVLQSLSRRSMLQKATVADGGTRYLMLESLREFGLDKLVRSGEEEEARLAHGEWIIALAEEAGPNLAGPRQAAWLNRLDDEMENIRAALAWSLHGQRGDIALRVIGVLWPFLRERGLVSASREWLRRGLEHAGPSTGPHRAKALNAAGNLAHDHRDLDVARAYFEQARSLAEATGDIEQEIEALYGLGHVASGKACFAESAELNRMGLHLASQTGLRRLMATGEANLGLTAYYQGKIEDAIRYFDAAAVVLRGLGDESGEALMLSNIGGASLLTGDLARAEEYTLRAIALQRKLRTLTRLLSSLNNLGLVHMLQGRMDEARAVLMEALAMHRKNGNLSGQSHVTHSLSNVELESGNVKGAASLFVESLGLVLETGDVSGIVHYVQLLISICSANGDHADAVMLLAAESRLRHEAEYELSEDDRENLDLAMESARTALDDDDFRRHWALGSAMDQAEVLERMPGIARGIAGRQVDEPEIAWPAETTVTEDQVEPEYHLTSRELEILRLLGRGTSTQEIAATLRLSPRTVSTHIGNVLAKMDVTSRTAAVARALRDGVISAGGPRDGQRER
jgi:predicted ATPase/DNA-binding CsgD family transcriptional regulator